MKYIKYFIVAIFSFFIINSSVLAASSKFEITVNMQPDITENQVNVLVGFTGEDVMAVSHNFAYDSSKLTLVDIIPLDTFTITKGHETINGKWKSIPILADSNYSFTSTNYAVIVFEVNKGFKINNKADVFFYNAEAAGPDKSKYRSNGKLMVMDKESPSEMYFLTEEINDSTKIKYWILEHIVLIVLVILGVIATVLLLVFLPTRRKKEHRDANLNNQIKRENYDGASSIKIDQNVLDQIGAETKPIDMKDAIIYNEEIKPFGDITARNENIGNTELLGNNVQNFGVVNNNNENTQVLDAFSTKPTIEDSGFVELNDESNVNNSQENESLTLFQPQDFEDINDTNKSNTNNNLFGLIILFILSITLFSGYKVYAEEQYRINDLRECIVGNIPYNKDLDYSGDGRVDVLDIIYTKDLSNTVYQEEQEVDPGFKEINGQSDNLISTAQNES